VIEAVARLAYEESLRLLEIQRESVDGLRTRAGTLLAAAALVTTFLGGQALAGAPSIGWWEWAAIVLFIGTCACTLLVLLPWKLGWGEKTNSLIVDYVRDEKMTPERMLSDLALKHKKSRESNERTVGWLQWGTRIAVILLALEVVSWLVEIGANS